jgi:hypothetical protein
MKNVLLLSFLFGMLGTAQAQTGVFTLLHNGQASFFYQPDALLNDIIANNAVPGDTIILPGGEVGQGLGISITKPLTIIGAGIYPEGAPVTNITTISNGPGGSNASRLYLTDDASGVKIQGVKITRSVQISNDITNALFDRCDFTNTVTYIFNTLDNYSPTGLIFSQCIFRDGVNFFLPGLGISISNSVIENNLMFGTYMSNGQITQCIFLDSNLGSSGINQGVTYTNCAFINSSSGGMVVNNASTFYHCLFAPDNGTVTFGTDPVHIGDQITTFNSNNIFTNASADDFGYEYDYTPAPGSDLLGNGVDGQNIGLYGPGTTGWKPYAIPSNPHWTQFTPNGNIVTNGGTIQVHIKAEAQQN